MGIKSIWTDVERTVKDVRGKDVPESPLRDKPDLKALLETIGAYMEGKLIDWIEENKEAAFIRIQAFSDSLISREQYEAVIKALIDEIKEAM